MDIQAESPNNTSSAPVVDAIVPPAGVEDVQSTAPANPATEAKPLTGMEAIGTPQMPEILATAQTKASEVADAKKEPQTSKPNPIKRIFGAMGFGGGTSAPVAAAATTPDHLTQTPDGTLQTPAVPLVSPDAAAAVNQTTGVSFQNSIPSPENSVTASPTEQPAPTEIVASDAPSLGTSQPEVAPQPTEAVTPEPATATTLTQDMENAGEHPAVLETVAPETPAVFTPSADVTPAEEVSTLPETPTAAAVSSDVPVAAMPFEGLEDPTPKPAETPIAEPQAETPDEEKPEELPVGQSAVANDEAVHAGPGAVTNGAPAPTDWSVNADLHLDAPIVPGHEDALGQAMADGVTAASERPPFSAAALNEPAGQTEEVGHDIPIETGSEPATGEAADVVAASADTDVEPTAPVVAVPGGMSPINPIATATGPGVVDDAGSLDAGLPQTPKMEVVPNSTDVNNVIAFPGSGNQTSAEATPVALAGEAPSNVTSFPTTTLAEEKPAA